MTTPKRSLTPADREAIIAAASAIVPGNHEALIATMSADNNSTVYILASPDKLLAMIGDLLEALITGGYPHPLAIIALEMVRTACSLTPEPSSETPTHPGPEALQ